MEVKLNNIDYTYNQKTKLEHEVLKKIDMHFKEKTVTTIMSSSGGGKTTILKIISDLLKPTNGKVEFIKKGNEHLFSKVGLVFKNPEEQFIYDKVRKELEFTIKNLPKQKREKKMIETLKKVGLNKTYLNKNPFNLSKGEMKKIAIASILICNPRVIIFDEPSIGLDDKNKEELAILINSLKQKNKTIIIASRDSDFTNKVTDYIYVLLKGRIILEGEKYKVFTNDLFLKSNIKLPKIIEFSKLANNKRIDLQYRSDLKDLMKDIYSSVTS